MHLFALEWASEVRLRRSGLVCLSFAVLILAGIVSPEINHSIYTGGWSPLDRSDSCRLYIIPTLGCSLLAQWYVEAAGQLSWTPYLRLNI